MSEVQSERHPPLNIEELLRADAFPHPVSQLRLVETHISWVVLTGSFAYKIKKPVKLGFIDTSTLELRQHYCNEEVRLNRRLAPELYLDVVPITREHSRVRAGGQGDVIEYAVRMKQFPTGNELDALLDRGDVSLQEIEQLAELLGQFHQQIPSPTPSQDLTHTRSMFENVLGNLEQLSAHAPDMLDVALLRQLRDWTRASLDAQRPAFEKRERTGHIRDCHGDLHAANIVRIDGRLVPFDCIDFDPRLRHIDVMNDLAFLVMDLRSRDRQDLATALLNRYLEVTGDYEGVQLLPFYAVYRALVRAKVDAIAANQSPERVSQLTERFQRRIRTALQLMNEPSPTLLLMHGPSGSGKSWLSEQLVPRVPALRIRSDLERRRLLGEARDGEDKGFKTGRYAPEMSRRIYSRMVECADSCLQGGCNVIIDAAFLNESDRELFESLASRAGVNCAFISCHADEATLLERVSARAAQGRDVSEADRDVVTAQLRTFEPLQSRPDRRVIHADTRDPDVTRTVVAAIEAMTAA
ncbi:MAG TPA: AAA family ATPase [Steroidobacter sp.]|uniref:bifunctional aminoglycoside phosphotransferase/ATP-binding protein n=1 Tax=Steroidobacter sp. TaxID=1978227 RepID=UPI002ED7FCF2